MFTIRNDAVMAQAVECPRNVPEHPSHSYQPEWNPAEGMSFPADMELCDYDEGELLC